MTTRQNGHDLAVSASGTGALVDSPLLSAKVRWAKRRVVGQAQPAARGDGQPASRTRASPRGTEAAAPSAAIAPPMPVRTGPDPMLACEWDVIRLFGLFDIAQDGLKAGWAYPEDEHTWNEGLHAILVLAVEGGSGAATLVIEGEPYVTHQQPTQDMSVTVNGHVAAFWRMTERAGQTLRIDIEPEWWVTRRDRPVLNVGFHLPDSVKPIDIGEGQDGRAIGFCFRSLVITRAEDT